MTAEKEYELTIEMAQHLYNKICNILGIAPTTLVITSIGSKKRIHKKNER